MSCEMVTIICECEDVELFYRTSRVRLISSDDAVTGSVSCSHATSVI